MAELNPRMKVALAGDVTVVTLTDRKILDEVNIAQIGDQLGKLVAQNAQPKMVLDFTNVSHMSSSALGMLITLHKRIREKNGQLRLAAIQPAIYEVFVITRLNEILKISATQEDALQNMQ